MGAVLIEANQMDYILFSLWCAFDWNVVLQMKSELMPISLDQINGTNNEWWTTITWNTLKWTQTFYYSVKLRVNLSKSQSHRIRWSFIVLRRILSLEDFLGSFSANFFLQIYKHNYEFSHTTTNKIHIGMHENVEFRRFSWQYKISFSMQIFFASNSRNLLWKNRKRKSKLRIFQ